MKHKQSGSVFFYILLAIILFAALSYAISSNRSGSTNILTDEQAKLSAQEIIEYGNTVASAVQKLKLRGCSDTQISFENAVITGYSNVNAPTDKSCHVFDVNGGNINFPSFNNNIYDLALPNFTPRVSINGDNRVTNIGSSKSELIFFTSDIKQNICRGINNILHSNETPFTGTDITAGGTKFTGTYYVSPAVICPSTPATKLSGCCYESIGCSGGACYHFYQVLIAR